MSTERYQQLKAIFYAASEVAAAERAGWLDGACGADADLRAEVERLLSPAPEAAEFMNRPLLDVRSLIEHAPPTEAEPEPLPLSIGRYRILRLIGEGGMGIVYEAEQDAPRRIVALKVIRSALASGKARERFVRESEILGRLNHDGIAQIHDAGVAAMRRADGSTTRVPFFAMEKVEGTSLLEHAQTHRLDNRQRLALLARVCDAVHHGHEQGVIHRDLKPGNILVTAAGDPKVIDFGVARATDADIAVTTQQTAGGQLLGTLAYMSPEQVTGDRSAVDCRSDVYALGVIAFELLSGSMPYDLAGMMLPEAVRTIRDVEPARLSSISRIWRGDIETIIAKALVKEPARRYQSAHDLAQDIRRYLRDEPIVARPPSVRYQLGKFARRHKELVAAAVMVVLVLIAAVIAISIQLAIALRQGALAEMEAKRATAASSYMRDLLASANPGIPGGGRDVRVVDVLDRAAASLGDSMQDQPGLEMHARWIIGDAYLGLGEYTEAGVHLERALELALELGGPSGRETLLISSRLAQLACEFDRYSGPDGAVELIGAAIERGRAAFEPTDEVMQQLLLTAATIMWAVGEPEESVNLYRELRDVLERLPPAERRAPMLVVLANLGGALQQVQRRDEADLVLREALALFEEAPDHALLFTRRTLGLGQHLANQGMHVEAERCLRRILDVQRQMLGPAHAEPSTTLDSLATFLAYAARFDDAIEVMRERLEIADVTTPGGMLGAGMLYGNIGQMHAMARRETEAAAAFAEAIRLCRGSFGDDHALTHAWWRESVIRLGYGLHQPWAGEALRWHGCRALDDALRAAPTVTLDQQELRWETLRFTLERWSAEDERTGGHAALRAVASGGLAQLQAMADPPPGVYRLSLALERAGAVDELRASAWMLVAPWQANLYQAWNWSTLDSERWAELAASHPRQTRHLPALCLANWWERGYGPGRIEHYFAIVATASITGVPAGEYVCTVTADDGARLTLDGTMVIESWADLAWAKVAPTLHAEVTLGPGEHRVRVEHFQITGDARLWVRLVPAEMAPDEGGQIER